MPGYTNQFNKLELKTTAQDMTVLMDHTAEKARSYSQDYEFFFYKTGMKIKGYRIGQNIPLDGTTINCTIDEEIPLSSAISISINPDIQKLIFKSDATVQLQQNDATFVTANNCAIHIVNVHGASCNIFVNTQTGETIIED